MSESETTRDGERVNLPDKASIPPWWNDGREPTNAELAHWLSVTSDANRDWWLDRVKTNTRDAARCFEYGHDDAIEILSQQLKDARSRVAFLERHYQAAEQRP